MEADFVKRWKLEADFGKIWKLKADLEKKIVSWKPILKILVKLAIFFKKPESWYLNFRSWKGRRKCEVGVNNGKIGNLKIKKLHFDLKNHSH